MLSKEDFRPVIEKKLGTPIACSNFRQPGEARNTYSLLGPYSGRAGIYRFTGEGGVTLYVGTAGYGNEQGLKERVSQHLTPGDSGGTFRERLAKDRFNNDQVAAVDWILKNTYLQLVETPPEEHSELEKLAIDIFKPKYCGRQFDESPV